MRKMMSGKGKMGAMMKQMTAMKGKGGKTASPAWAADLAP